MTVPAYSEDLTDVSLADESTGWVELTGTDQDSEAYNANGAPAYEDDEYPYIQGLYAVTQDTTKSTSVGSLAYSSGGITIPTDGALFLWHNYSSPFAMGTYAQGGYRICMGSGLADFDVWYVGGSDKDNNPYGGWVNHVVNDTVTRDNWAGTSTSIDYVGSAISVISGPSKGEPHQVDAVRYGRGSAIFEFGETANYCTIAGFAAANDAQAARWGLIQSTSGGYLWKGRWSLGTATNAVDFRDSNQTIFLQWTPKVTINFNTIEVLNTSSNIEMDGFQFIVLDPTGTASRGRWITTNDATVVITSCTFNDMYTFVFDSNTTITDSNFKRCNQITQGGATFDGCNIDSSDSAVSLVADSLADITDCTFTSDGSNHGLNLGTIAATASVSWNNYLSGYETYAAGGTSTGNEAILVSVDSGQTLTINVGAGYDTPSYYNTGLGDVVVSNSVDLEVNGVFTGTEPTNYVRCRIETSASTGDDELDTYYFDASDTGPTDTGDYWNSDANGFDGSTSTFTSPDIDDTQHTITAEGTNAPSSGNTITQVRARIYAGDNSLGSSVGSAYWREDTALTGTLLGSDTSISSTAEWSGYTTLTAPSGGWTWAKVQSLAVDINATSSSFPANAEVYKVEVEVTSHLDVEGGTTIMNEEAQTAVGDGTYKATEAYNYAADVAVTIKARYKGYLPFKTSGTITSTGLKVTAVWVVDSNYT